MHVPRHLLLLCVGRFEYETRAVLACCVLQEMPLGCLRSCKRLCTRFPPLQPPTATCSPSADMYVHSVAFLLCNRLFPSLFCGRLYFRSVAFFFVCSSLQTSVCPLAIASSFALLTVADKYSWLLDMALSPNSCDSLPVTLQSLRHRSNTTSKLHVAFIGGTSPWVYVAVV
jgi:hypothetical protein